jgi:hypothetical protein
MPARKVEGDLFDVSEFWMGTWQGGRECGWLHSHSMHGDWQGTVAISEIRCEGINITCSRTNDMTYQHVH